MRVVEIKIVVFPKKMIRNFILSYTCKDEFRIENFE